MWGVETAADPGAVEQSGTKWDTFPENHLPDRNKLAATSYESGVPNRHISAPQPSRIVTCPSRNRPVNASRLVGNGDADSLPHFNLGGGGE